MRLSEQKKGVIDSSTSIEPLRSYGFVLLTGEKAKGRKDLKLREDECHLLFGCLTVSLAR
jgi:hypothetical protein